MVETHQGFQMKLEEVKPSHEDSQHEPHAAAQRVQLLPTLCLGETRPSAGGSQQAEEPVWRRWRRAEPSPGPPGPAVGKRHRGRTDPFLEKQRSPTHTTIP